MKRKTHNPNRQPEHARLLANRLDCSLRHARRLIEQGDKRAVEFMANISPADAIPGKLKDMTLTAVELRQQLETLWQQRHELAGLVQRYCEQADASGTGDDAALLAGAILANAGVNAVDGLPGAVDNVLTGLVALDKALRFTGCPYRN